MRASSKETILRLLRTKAGNEIPDRLCTLHQGTIRQRVTRTVQNWLSEAGRRVRAIFR